MSNVGYSPSRVGLDRCGLDGCGEVYWNPPPAELYEHALRAGEGTPADNGAIVCTTGDHTGRSPNDKFFVEEPGSRDEIWCGKVNAPISEGQFDLLHGHVIEHCRGRKLYVRDMFAGADEATRVPIRVVTETAWHSLFAAQLFILPVRGSTSHHDPQFTVLNVPTCEADPRVHARGRGR